MEIIADYGNLAIGPVLTVLALALTWALKAATDNAKARSIMIRLGAAAKSAVLTVAQTYVDSLKAGRADDSDGGSSLTDEEKAAARSMALRAAKAWMGKRALKELAGVVGAAAVDEVITNEVEGAVKELKAADPSRP